MLTLKNIQNISLPDISLPDISLPDISLPDISLPDISLWDINFSFILLILPFITFIIKDRHNMDILKGDIEYLLLFKEKCTTVTNLNERLMVKNKSLKTQITENIKDIECKDKRIKVLEKELNQLNKEKSIVLPLKEPDFGNGLLRVCNNNIYYHGVCHEENHKWNQNNKCSKYIYEYKLINKKRRNLDTYKTYNIDKFCNNCLLINEKNKYSIFQCQGHEY